MSYGVHAQTEFETVNPPSHKQADRKAEFVPALLEK